jgi:hypothetical protein
MNIFSSVKQRLIQNIQTLEQNKKDFVKNPDRDFTRKRKLTFFDTIMLIISMECGTIRSELLKYFSYSPETATSSAFIQQRDKIKPGTFRSLFYAFSDSFSSESKDGYHYFAVDGSDVLIPLEEENETYRYFGREDQRPYYQIHLNAIYNLISKRYEAAYIEPRKGHNERNAFDLMFEEKPFPEKSIFIFDRGYEGYPLMAHISQKNQFFVIRAKDRSTGGILKSLDLPAEDEFDTTFNKILVNNLSLKHKQNPDLYHRVHFNPKSYYLNDSVKEFPLSFRIVRLRLKNGSYECLLTNLPREEFDIAALKEIYNSRWGIETSFRQLKYTIGLLHFHSKKIESIEQEIWARLILYNYCMIVTANIKERKNNSRYQYRLNIANAIHICRKFLKLLIDETLPNIEKLISGELLPVRAERKAPRNKSIHQPRKFNYRVV